MFDLSLTFTVYSFDIYALWARVRAVLFADVDGDIEPHIRGLLNLGKQIFSEDGELSDLCDDE